MKRSIKIGLLLFFIQSQYLFSQENMVGFNASLNNYQIDINTNENQKIFSGKEPSCYSVNKNLLKTKRTDIDIDTKINAIGYSYIFPGLGQLYSTKQNFRGALYLASGISSIGLILYSKQKATFHEDEYLNAMREYTYSTNIGSLDALRDEMLLHSDEMEKYKDYQKYGLITTGILYGISIIDAIIWGGRIDHTKAMSSNDKLRVSLGVSNEDLLKINYKIGN